MHRTRLLGVVAVASAMAFLPAAAAAAPGAHAAAPARFSIDVGSSEAAQASQPSGIIAVLIGLAQAPAPPPRP